MTALGSRSRSKSLTFGSVEALFWSMTMMGLIKNESQATNGSVSAIECGLWWCVKSYKSVVNNGILTEIAHPVFSKKDPNSWLPILEPDGIEYVSSPQTFSKFRTRLLNHSTPERFPKRTDLRLGEGYNVSQPAFYAMANTMHNIFTMPEGDQGLYFGYNAYVSGSLDSSDDDTLSTPGTMWSLYHSLDLEATFATLAKSMTNYIRQNSDNHTVVNGKEGKHVVLIRIRWWFLIPSVILIVGGAIFLAVVLHKTYMFKIEFWGTNVLPIIVMGSKMGPVFNDDDDMKAITLEQIAKRQFIQFPTFQAHRDVERIETSNRNENHEMDPSSRTSVIQRPSDDAVNTVSLLRTSVIHSSDSDAVSMISNEA